MKRIDRKEGFRIQGFLMPFKDQVKEMTPAQVAEKVKDGLKLDFSPNAIADLLTAADIEYKRRAPQASGDLVARIVLLEEVVRTLQAKVDLLTTVMCEALPPTEAEKLRANGERTLFSQQVKP